MEVYLCIYVVVLLKYLALKTNNYYYYYYYYAIIIIGQLHSFIIAIVFLKGEVHLCFFL